MFKKISIELLASDEEKPTFYWGYPMYGILLESLDSIYADFLHNLSVKPLSQNIISHNDNKNTAIWTINLLNSNAIENISPIIEKAKSYNMHKNGAILDVKSIAVKEISEKDFCDGFFLNAEPVSSYEIKFLTPCSFKTENQYAIFPTPQLILRSLLQKWNNFSEYMTLEDDDAFEHLFTHSKILKYNLKSVGYHVKGVKLSGFIGSVTLSIRGPQPLIRLFDMIMSFAEYSGIGMKTALGMGAVEVKPRILK